MGMGEHLTGIIVVGIGIIIVVTIVLLSQASVLDNATREMIQSELTEFGNTIAKNKEITLEGYYQLKEKIAAAGINSDVKMSLVVSDVNLGKKVSQAQKDKIGENATYEIHHAQIMEVLEEKGRYPLPPNSTYTVIADSSSESMSQVLSNSFFRTNGKDSGTTIAQYTTLIP